MTAGSYPFRTLQVAGEAEQELVGDGVHQVEKSGVLVQNVVQRRPLESQILRENRERDLKRVSLSLGTLSV